MKVLGFARRVTFTLAAAVVLAACGTRSGPPISLSRGAIGATASSAIHSTTRGYAVPPLAGVVAHVHAYHGKNWMEPGANKKRLLYVSDANNGIVQVYNYPSQGTQTPPAGTLTGFVDPQGMCVDDSNNVYVVDLGRGVLKYAYGASSPSATYNLGYEWTVNCSWDRTTGNLAVADILSASGEAGVTICRNPSSCITYNNPAGIASCYFIGYMPNGDLYVDGLNYSSGFAMIYLPAGGSTWQSVSLSGATINFPGNIQYDGTYLTVGDQSGPSGFSVIHQCKASGARVDCGVGETDLLTSSDVVQYFIKRGVKGVIGPDARTGDANTWSYPAGGQPRPNKIIHVSQSSPLNVGSALLLP